MAQFNHADFVLRLTQLKDAQNLLNFRLRNRDYLMPFEPLRYDSHYQLVFVTDIS